MRFQAALPKPCFTFAAMRLFLGCYFLQSPPIFIYSRNTWTRNVWFPAAHTNWLLNNCTKQYVRISFCEHFVYSNYLLSVPIYSRSEISLTYKNQAPVHQKNKVSKCMIHLAIILHKWQFHICQTNLGLV